MKIFTAIKYALKSAIVALAFITVLPYESQAQFDWEATPYSLSKVGQQVFVVQPAGAWMIKKPSAKSERIVNVPYGEKVIVAGKESESETVLDTVSGRSINGTWVDVTWGSKRGFLFSPYLHGEVRAVKHAAHLLFPFNTCYNNFRFDPNLNYYGVYRKQGNAVLRKVDASFLIHKGDGDGQWYQMAFRASRPLKEYELVFVVGLKNELKEGNIRAVVLTESDANITHSSIKTIPGIGIKLQSSYTFLKIQQDRPLKSQILSKLDYCNKLEWCGDVDQDGRLDYIFYSGDKGVTADLFLSSLARDHELVGRAGGFFFPLCD
jgi:hypothetical protein